MASTADGPAAQGYQPDLEKTTSKISPSNAPPIELLANEADAELLGTLINIWNYLAMLIIL